jgi:putative GTP pyrophosphokinase
VYDDNITAYERLRAEGLYIMEAGLKGARIKLDSISSRIKELNSILEKTKRKQLSQPFEEIRDIVGLRFVCLFLSDIQRISEIIHRDFVVLTEDNKIDGHEVATFGYMSLHYAVTLRPEYTGPRYEGITGIPFEVQVRTIAMNAWGDRFPPPGI